MKQEVYDYIFSYLCDRLKYVKGSKHDIRCACPFHGGNNATSFRVCFTKSEPFFNCWACHESGDLVKLIAFLDSISHSQALRKLRKQTTFQAIDLNTVSKQFEKLREMFSRQAEARKRQPPALPPMADDQRPMYEYLKARSKRYHGVLNVQYIVNRYQLYYCNTGRMAGRIIMPLYINGKLITYNDRSIDNEAKNKSLHPPGVEFDEMVYGLDQAVGKEVAVIVEGAFDTYQVVCALHKHRKLAQKYGSVTLMNNRISDGKLNLVAQNFDRAVVLLDHDHGGLSMMNEVCSHLEEIMPTSNATELIPREKDPGKCTADQLIRAITHAGEADHFVMPKLSLKGKRL
jgi:hypothetical protein